MIDRLNNIGYTLDSIREELRKAEERGEADPQMLAKHLRHVVEMQCDLVMLLSQHWNQLVAIIRGW